MFRSSEPPAPTVPASYFNHAVPNNLVPPPAGTSTHTGTNPHQPRTEDSQGEGSDTGLPVLPVPTGFTPQQQREYEKDLMQAPRDKVKPLLSRTDDLGHFNRHMSAARTAMGNKIYSPIQENWLLNQVETGSEAYHRIQNALNSGNMQRNLQGCFFPDFPRYMGWTFELFFGDRSPWIVIEQFLDKLRVGQGNDSHIVRSSVELANVARDLFAYAPPGEKLSEPHQVARIRRMLPNWVDTRIRENEIIASRSIDNFKLLYRILPELDRQFATKRQPQEGEGTSRSAGQVNPKGKRTRNLTAVNTEADRRGKKPREVPTCDHCHKKGHTIDNCWDKYPEKAPKGKGAKKNNKFAKKKARLQALLKEITLSDSETDSDAEPAAPAKKQPQ